MPRALRDRHGYRRVHDKRITGATGTTLSLSGGASLASSTVSGTLTAAQANLASVAILGGSATLSNATTTNLGVTGSAVISTLTSSNSQLGKCNGNFTQRNERHHGRKQHVHRNDNHRGSLRQFRPRTLRILRFPTRLH